MAYSAFAGWSAPNPAADAPRLPYIPRTVAGSPWLLRAATAVDEPAIRALIRAERMNPTRLHYAGFIVACIGPVVVGAAQIRRHRDGSREFGSLVVAQGCRGRGIGTALLRTLLAQGHDRLHVITGRAGAGAYERLGFRRVPGGALPRAVRLNLRIGQLAGIVGRLRGRRPQELWALERPEQPAKAPLAAAWPRAIFALGPAE